MLDKLSGFVAALGWVSFFVLIWRCLLDDNFSGGRAVGLVVFLLIAVVSSIVSTDSFQSGFKNGKSTAPDSLHGDTKSGKAEKK